MKILLVNPPAENMLATEVPEFLSEERGHNPPLGLLYIASSLIDAGHKVEVLDSQVEELDYRQVAARIRKSSPDVVGLTVMSFTLIDAMLTAETTKQLDSSTKVVFGGPHPTIYPKETLNLDNVDYVILGEGERTMTKLLGALENDKPLSEIRGVAYKENNGVKNTGMAPFIHDLDSLPFPARKLTPYKKYTSLLAKRSPITTLFSSRGCPYKCLFCDRPQMGKLFRARSAVNVVDEITECAQLGIREFLIYDDTFTVERQRVVDVCSEIKQRGLDVGWDIRARVNTVDPKLLKTLRSAGCERIHYGVEAGNQEILDILRKGITLAQAEKAFKATKQAGIETLAYFMIGSPGETRETIRQSIDFSKKLDADYCHFSITTPFPATDLYRMGLDEKILPKDSWLEFAEKPSKDFVSDVWEENLTREQLNTMLRSAYKSFYVRPSYITKQVLKIRSPSELLRKVRAGLKVIAK